MLLSLIVFIVVLSVLVFVHELGHFSVAKWVGMRVDEFAIGFPPRLFSWIKGDTRYSLNAIPVGGYVRIHGESSLEPDADPGSFHNKSVWARIAVIIAGVVMNFLFALVALSIAFSIGFPTGGLPIQDIPGAIVVKNDIYLSDILADSAAAKAGIKAGEQIVSFTDVQTGETTAISSEGQLLAYTKSKQEAKQVELEAVLKDGDESRTVPLTLSETGYPLGAALASDMRVKVPTWRTPQASMQVINAVTVATWDALKGFASQLFVHAKIDQNISGPVGIYQASSAAAHQGIVSVVMLMVILSLNLALLNILPIPALDGGRLVFLVIELIFRKKVVSERIEHAFTIGGFALLMALIVLVTVKDIIKLF